MFWLVIVACIISMGQCDAEDRIEGGEECAKGSFTFLVGIVKVDKAGENPTMRGSGSLLAPRYVLSYGWLCSHGYLGGLNGSMVTPLGEHYEAWAGLDGWRQDSKPYQWAVAERCMVPADPVYSPAIIRLNTPISKSDNVSYIKLLSGEFAGKILKNEQLCQKITAMGFGEIWENGQKREFGDTQCLNLKLSAAAEKVNCKEWYSHDNLVCTQGVNDKPRVCSKDEGAPVIYEELVDRYQIGVIYVGQCNTSYKYIPFVRLDNFEKFIKGFVEDAFEYPGSITFSSGSRLQANAQHTFILVAFLCIIIFLILGQ